MLAPLLLVLSVCTIATSVAWRQLCKSSGQHAACNVCTMRRPSQPPPGRTCLCARGRSSAPAALASSACQPGPSPHPLPSGHAAEREQKRMARFVKRAPDMLQHAFNYRRSETGDAPRRAADVFHSLTRPLRSRPRCSHEPCMTRRGYSCDAQGRIREQARTFGKDRLRKEGAYRCAGCTIALCGPYASSRRPIAIGVSSNPCTTISGSLSGPVSLLRGQCAPNIIWTYPRGLIRPSAVSASERDALSAQDVIVGACRDDRPLYSANALFATCDPAAASLARTSCTRYY
jgi:hypothetical protein